MSSDIFSKSLGSHFSDHKNEQINRQERIIQEKEKQIQNIGKAYNEKLRKAKSEERAAINHIKSVGHKNIELENSKAQYAITKIRDNHNKTYEHIKTKGELRIDELSKALEKKKTYYKQKLNELDAYYKNEGNKLQRKHLKELQDRHSFNLEMYKKSEDQALKSVALREKEIISRFIENPTIPGDAFYQLSGYQAQLVEDDEFYTLLLNVPEHDRKNVNVIIKPNQFTVSAQRAHSQQHEGIGRKIETHNYQSTRDVLALEHPVDKKQVIESYDVNAQMLVIQVKKA